MSLLSTSRPVFSETRLLRIRAPVFFCSWWKWIVWSRTAEYALTGMLTSPKEIEPDQIARAMEDLYPVRRQARPDDCRPRRETASIVTASRSTAPVTMNLTEDC